MFGFSSTARANVGLLSDSPLQRFVPSHLLILLVWIDCLEPRPNLHRQRGPLPEPCSNAHIHKYSTMPFTSQPEQTGGVNASLKTAPHTEED